MHPKDCQWWEYEKHPDAHLVGERCIAVLADLRRGVIEIVPSLKDMRGHHKRLFVGTTPDNCPYLAGHYRGEKFRCLEFLEVQVAGDPRVGVPSGRVLFDIANFAAQIIAAGVSALDAAFQLPDAQLSQEEKLNYLVVFSCRVLVEFLRIHPFGNGNGHVGRLIVWLLLARYGYWPKRWPLDESPPYDKLLKDYRDGSFDGLEAFVFRSIVGS